MVARSCEDHEIKSPTDERREGYRHGLRWAWFYELFPIILLATSNGAMEKVFWNWDIEGVRNRHGSAR